MSDPASPCTDERLELLLHSDETHVDFRTAAEHLESCSACQTRLADLAANDEEWTQAQRSLAPKNNDAQLDLEEEERSWNATGQRRPPKSWTDSMTSQMLSPPSHPEMLGRLGRYEVERIIGSGGMGVVFKAFDSELNRPVAVKVLAPHLAGCGAARTRFAREARAAAAIVHEHVVAIHNVESEHEPPFLVMQYVAGESLQVRLDREGPLRICEVLRIARQIAAGLAAAHQQGLVHRDVKPSNVLLEEGIDRALLTDFGLARASDDASLTHSGHIPGTPHYMSPEQARGEDANQLSDLFSLASLMYAMCTGRSPFRAETSYGVLRRITDSQPRCIRDINADAPLWLCCLIEKLHEKTPQDRFESASEVADLLGQCLAHVQQPQIAPLPRRLEVLARKRRRESARANRWMRLPALIRGLAGWKGAAAVVGVALLVGAILVRPDLWRDSAPSPQVPAGPTLGKRTPSIGQPVSHDPATDWVAADEEVRRVREQVDEFTLRLDSDWRQVRDRRDQ